jgi:hypothetical protein
MPAECTPCQFEFEAVSRRSVVAGFDGGEITSNGGALLLARASGSRPWTDATLCPMLR